MASRIISVEDRRNGAVPEACGGQLDRALPTRGDGAGLEALSYCDKFPLDDLPDDATHLLQLVQSVVMAAMCVEIWYEPR
jgi:hypothetical protein